jgi:hypothetical protein
VDEAGTNRSLSFIEACDLAAGAISRLGGLEQLYSQAMNRIGEGEVRTAILERAVEAFEDESLSAQVLVSRESLVSFFCGIWIQFLLVEIGGIEKGRLRSTAGKILREMQEGKTIH